MQRVPWQCVTRLLKRVPLFWRISTAGWMISPRFLLSDLSPTGFMSLHLEHQSSPPAAAAPLWPRAYTAWLTMPVCDNPPPPSSGVPPQVSEVCWPTISPTKIRAHRSGNISIWIEHDHFRFFISYVFHELESFCVITSAAVNELFNNMVCMTDQEIDSTLGKCCTCRGQQQSSGPDCPQTENYSQEKRSGC